MHAFVDYRITHEELKNLEKLNINPIIVPKTSTVYKAIDGHPDIQLNILKNNYPLIFLCLCSILIEVKLWR